MVLNTIFKSKFLVKNMISIQKIVEELDEEDLYKILCYRCISSGMRIENSLYSGFGEMITSEVTNDLICEHCYVVENEEGYEKMSDAEIHRVWGIIEKFEKYKKQRLNNIHRNKN